MPKCKNNDKKYYTGREKTPRGKGLDSEKFKDGSRKRGTDGRMYESRGNVWKAITPAGVRGGMSSPKRKKKTSRGREEDYDYSPMYSDEQADDPKNQIAAFGGGYAPIDRYVVKTGNQLFTRGNDVDFKSSAKDAQKYADDINDQNGDSDASVVKLSDADVKFYKDNLPTSKGDYLHPSIDHYANLYPHNAAFGGGYA